MKTLDDLEPMFKSLNWEFRKISTGFMLSCPLAKWTHQKRSDNNPSCVVWPKRDYWKCYSCGNRGNIEQLFHKFSELSNTVVDFELDPLCLLLENSIDEEIDTSPFVLDEEILSIFANDPEFILNSEIFKRPGYSFELVKTFGLLADKKYNRIVFPVRDISGKLLGAVGRSIKERSKFKVYNYFNFESGKTLGGIHKISKNKKIAIVEGFTDLLNCYFWAEELGFDVVCSWTANVTQTQADSLMDLGKTIHCWFDQDAAGDRGWRTLERRCQLDYGLTRHVWKSNILDPLDIGNMTRSQFFQIFQEQ